MVSIFLVVVSTPDGAVSGSFAFTVAGSVISGVSIFVVVASTSDVCGSCIPVVLGSVVVCDLVVSISTVVVSISDVVVSGSFVFLVVGFDVVCSLVVVC